MTPKQRAEASYDDLPQIIKNAVTKQVYCVAFLQGYIARGSIAVEGLIQAIERKTGS